MPLENVPLTNNANSGNGNSGRLICLHSANHLARILIKLNKQYKKYLPVMYQDPSVEAILRPGVRYVACRGISLANILLPSTFNTAIKY